MSYGDELQVLDLSNRGIKLVVGENEKDGGSNGSGKSTAVVDAICYGLFGKTTKRSKADDVVNYSSGKNCYVEVNFKIGKKEYSVRRYRKDENFNNSLFFELNGEDFSGESKTSTQEKIESVIEISYKSFVSGIVLSQEKVANFADSDPLERRKIIENLLMYDFITKYHRATKEILRVISPEINNINSKIKDKKETVKTLKDNLLNYIDKKEREEENRENKIVELKKEKEKLEKLDLDRELSLRKRIKELTPEVENLRKSINEIEVNINEYNKEINRSNKKLNDKISEIDKAKENPDICPVCSNLIDEENFKKYINTKEKERDELSKIIEADKEKNKELESELERLDETFNEKKQELKDTKKGCSSELSDEDIEHSSDRITEINSEVKYLENNNIDLESDEWVISMSGSIDEHKNKLKKLKKKINKLEEEKEYYEWWKTALGNDSSSIKSFAINQILTSFNKYINYYLGFFGYDISYYLNDQLEETIMKDEYETNFNSFSGGEKRVLEISLVFALYEIIRLKLPDSVNILVLDELLSTSLDEVRINGTIEILNELEERSLSIFIIDHKSALKDSLECKTITVYKDKDGLSRLETEQKYKDN
jgi:DNA repair exonuclease SbcCD ATPase subunit